MKPISVKWTASVNMLQVECGCGRVSWVRLDRWTVRCACGASASIVDLRNRYAGCLAGEVKTMIEVAHIKSGVGGIRVDAWSGSPLGNPYSEKKYGRDECIRLFKIFLWRKMQISSSPQMAELLRLLAVYRETGKLTLLCWCAPKRCHAEVVAKAIEWLKSRD